VLNATRFTEINRDEGWWRNGLIRVFVESLKSLAKLGSFGGYSGGLDDGVDDKQTALSSVVSSGSAKSAM
jgi:hypothetical protein